jgi:hypothetical protein
MAQTLQQKARKRALTELHRGYNDYPGGHEATAYSVNAVRFLHKSRGTCRGCRGKRQLINGFCDVCRMLGANERQCMRASKR